MYRMMLVVLLSLAVTTLPLQAQDFSAELEKIVSDYTAADGAAVVVQVSSPDGVWVAAAGLADGERPTQAGDRFRIASMSKTFVAVTALLLAEDGVISLDDAAQDYLPDEIIENIANLDTVTIRELLQMRSGIDDYLDTDGFWDTAMADPSHEWRASEALEYAYDLPALFAPDSDYYYSNSNYLLLQLILEKASGQPLHSLIRDKILDPLDLKDTYTQANEDLPGGFVNGYEDMEGDGEVDEVSDFNDGAGLGDGGLISTTGDLTTFYQALLQDKTLLSTAAMQELLTFQPTEDGGYSLGLDRWETPYGDALGHSGAVSGFVSIGIYLPEQQTIIMVLSGNIDIEPETLALEAAEAVLG